MRWLICAVASIGFLFDTYELLMLPLIVRPALTDLVAARPDSAEFNNWVGIIFYVPAIAGGIFGLLGGYLTDRLGRRRVLVWSILIYGVSACGAAFATSVWTLLAFRCATFVGVCVEFVAAVAWLAELFPDAGQRERVIGWTQACASLGGLLVSAMYYVIVSYADSLPVVRGGHEPWRYMLVSGLIPALPLIVVRPFLPESPMWMAKRRAGTLRRPSIGEIFSPRFRTVTIVSAVLMTAGYAASFGANLQVPRIVPGLPEVQAMSRVAREQTVGAVQWLQELGGLAGRVALAYLAVRIVSRRRLIRAFIVPGVVVMPLVFFVAATRSLRLVEVGTFVAGFVTVAQFSFWGNYLPRVYPTHLRGTGESFAANIGGRMLGTGGAMVTAQLTAAMPGASPFAQLANAAGAVGVVSFVLALIASVWLPEPERAELPE
ncbi:MAG TPA: MFS transporter [Vicinamibacterales bacterium]|nr:MFS transporter [Vicinamibacterales bacterium]